MNPLAAILGRQAATTVIGGCPTRYFGCANLGAPQACCSSTAICTTDGQNHVACCASTASCTGIIGGDSGGGTTSATVGVNGAITTTTTQGVGAGSTLVATNGVIVTAGPAVNDAALRESWDGWYLGLIVCLLGLVG